MGEQIYRLRAFKRFIKGLQMTQNECGMPESGLRGKISGLGGLIWGIRGLNNTYGLRGLTTGLRGLG